MPLAQSYGLLADHPYLSNITMSQLARAMSLSRCLRRDIALPQPLCVNMKEAPSFLPPAIADFLADSINIESRYMQDLWDIIKEDVWEAPSNEEASKINEECFRLHGWKRELTSLTLYPPNSICTNNDCKKVLHELKKQQSRQVVVYSLSGACRAWSVHLYCPDCNSNYHHNYYVRGGMRTYYGGMPKYVQVGEHQFVEDKVITWWIASMLLGWMSAGNCKSAYERAYFTPEQCQDEEEGGWRFGMKLTVDHVWDAFVIWSLHRQHEKRHEIVRVPHLGDQKARFTALMQKRNEEVINHGQDELPHYCDKCMRVWRDENNNLHKCQVIVSDGLSMGHPCCGLFRCTTALANNRDRFCPQHYYLHSTCAVVGCDAGVVGGSKSCGNPDHQKMERAKTEKGAAFFTLKSRLDRHRVTHPTSSSPSEDNQADDNLEEGEVWFENHNGNVEIHHNPDSGSVGTVYDTEVPCESKKSATGNRKVKALFGRRRTHNEQTLVRPCGVIIARATFYGAEAVSNVLLFVKRVFSLPRAQKPEHLVYDTNCDAKQQVLARHDPWWDKIGMCVDVWHFLNKHKATHEFCQEHCNPADYPELMGSDGKWWFNTSIAEQVNVWLGGYHSMCREMLSVKYNFFLDEMIHLRNEITVAKLETQGCSPRHSPPQY